MDLHQDIDSLDIFFKVSFLLWLLLIQYKFLKNFLLFHEKDRYHISLHRFAYIHLIDK